MSLIAIIDAETTGTDPDKDHLIELAAILYSLTHAAVLQVASSLIHFEGDNPALEANRIKPAMARECPDDFHAINLIGRFVEDSDVIVAYNASFDRSFLEMGTVTLGKPWVCAMRAIDWPCKSSSKTLSSVALAHGVGIVSAHRAMADCDILARLFTRVHEMGTDLNELMRLAMRPRVKCMAAVSYDDRQLAKDAGFEWDPARRQWIGEVVAEERLNLPFPTALI